MSPPEIVGVVYQLTCLKSGKVYVGCTTGNPENRWYQHLKEAERGCGYALHRAIRKHGAEAFELKVLETVSGIHPDLLAAEVRWISKLGCKSPKGYNLTLGGQGIDFSVPETKEAQIRGSKERSARAEWREAQSKAKKLLHQDPKFKAAFLAGIRKAAQNPDWIDSTTRRNREQALDPGWKTALTKGLESRSEDPGWKPALREGAAKRKKDARWMELTLANLKEARARSTAKAIERDAMCSPEERAKRVRRREAVRRSEAKRKAANGPRRRKWS